MSSGPLNLPGEALLGSAGQSPVVTLTREQTDSKLIELRDVGGKLRGLLLHDSGMTILYTPERLAELRRRAAEPRPARTLREVVDSAVQRAREQFEKTKG